MDYRQLRQFDTDIRKYYLRIKEVWQMEKLGRSQIMGKDPAARQEAYGKMAGWAGELVEGLDSLDVPAVDFNLCRDSFLAAGKALQQACLFFPNDEAQALLALREYAYHLDSALDELKQLWAQYYAE